MEVSLFIPCYIDALAPDVAAATTRLLERLGCSVHHPSDPPCCGQPFVTAGATRAAARLARRFRSRLAGAETIVCPSGSCVATVRRRHPEMLGFPGGPADLLGSRTFELGEFLVGELGVTDVGAVFRHSVGLLHSCHGLRELGLGTPSEQVEAGPAIPGPSERLLRAVTGLELVDVERPDECCGFGGAFSLEYPEISTRIGRDRLRAFEDAGAEYITAADAGCLLHLDGLRRREGRGPRVIHLAELLDRRDP